MLNILIDENIAFAEKIFSEFGNVRLISGRNINNKEIKNTDVLIVRSITRVSKQLLYRSNVKFVGSATIGTDHLDIDYLRKEKIFYCNAPGSNSYSVAEYVITAIIYLAVKYNFNLNEKSVGIIGVGNIGKKVEIFAKALGMKVLLNDPPLKDKTSENKYLDLDEVLKADIITLHVPYTKIGKYKTHHLFDKNILSELNSGSVLINTSRGSVVDNTALNKIIFKKKLKTILDVWEGEPEINLDLLKNVELGTAHIAGYSFDGKINGTKTIYEHLCNFLGKKPVWNFEYPKVLDNILSLDTNLRFEESFFSLIKNIYDIKNDHNLLLGLTDGTSNFDNLRKVYRVRREFNNYNILDENMNEKIKNMLSALRFNFISSRDV